MSPPLRVALLGYGLAGRVIHRPLLAAEPGLVLTHVVTADPARRAQAAADVPEARLVDDATSLWADADAFDVVVVATGNLAHVPLAQAALERGKPTIVDKPLALSRADADALVREAAALQVPLGVFHNRRWDSDTRTADRLLRQGSLGEVHRLESRFTRFRPEVHQRWREDAAAGGGVLLDLGTHVVDQALHLLGPVASVYAEIAVTRAGARADDDVFLSLLHVSGARSHLWASMASPWPGPRLVLQGSLGGWSKDDLDGQEDALRAGGRADVPVVEPDGRRWTVDGGRPEPSEPGDWPAYYRAVAAALRGGTPLPVPAAEALPVLAVLEAARESVRTGAVVRPAGG